MDNGRHSRKLSLWLFVCAVMLVLTVIVWGIARLTEMGLTPADGKVQYATAPPANLADWRRGFLTYVRPRDVTAEQTPSGFQEEDYRYVRAWGRAFQRLCLATATVYMVPWVYLSCTDRLPPHLQPKLFLTFGLAVLQLLSSQSLLPGWLTTPLLDDHPSVDAANYRYTYNLMVALCVFCTLLWTAMTLLPAAHGVASPALSAKLWPLMLAIVVSAVFTIATGGLTAGIDAALWYREWPDLRGALPPMNELILLVPVWRNSLDGDAAMRGHHRLFAWTTLLLLIVLSRLAPPHTLPPTLSRALRVAQWATVLQGALGAAQVFYGPAVPIIAIHQGVGFALLAAYLWLTCVVRPRRAMEAASE
eukprot:EG_transcript_11776